MRYQTIRRPTLKGRLALAGDGEAYKQNGGHESDDSNPLALKG
jgi:hypothetical protein